MWREPLSTIGNPLLRGRRRCQRTKMLVLPGRDRSIFVIKGQGYKGEWSKWGLGLLAAELFPQRRKVRQLSAAAQLIDNRD